MEEFVSVRKYSSQLFAKKKKQITKQDDSVFTLKNICVKEKPKMICKTLFIMWLGVGEKGKMSSPKKVGY